MLDNGIGFNIAQPDLFPIYQVIVNTAKWSQHLFDGLKHEKQNQIDNISSLQYCIVLKKTGSLFDRNVFRKCGDISLSHPHPNNKSNPDENEDMKW